MARKKVAAFINASDSGEIVFTKNATEAINLVAYSWGMSNLKPEDEVCFCYSCNTFSFTYVSFVFCEPCVFSWLSVFNKTFSYLSKKKK